MQPNDSVHVVTGALGSIGFAIARGLAREGGTVVLVARDAGRAEDAATRLRTETGNPHVETLICDLGSMASIRAAAAELTTRHPVIHTLVNSAAIFTKTRKTTADGFELLMGTNHLAHFLFTNLLEGPLTASGRGRVVVMGMPAKNPIQFDDLMLEKKYDPMTALGMSKAATLYFTRELAERWQGRVTVNAIDPGMVKTTLIAEAPLPIRLVFALAASSPEKGAETPLWAALSPEAGRTTGKFFSKKAEKPFPPGSEDAAARRRLWDVSAQLVNL